MGQLHTQVAETEEPNSGSGSQKVPPQRGDLGCVEKTQENPLIRDMKKTQQNGLMELDQSAERARREEGWGCRPPSRAFPASLTLMGVQVLEVAVRMWDQAWRAVPLASRVNPDLTLLVSGQELGSIAGREMSWQAKASELKGPQVGPILALTGLLQGTLPPTAA